MTSDAFLLAGRHAQGRRELRPRRHGARPGGRIGQRAGQRDHPNGTQRFAPQPLDWFALFRHAVTPRPSPLRAGATVIAYLKHTLRPIRLPPPHRGAARRHRDRDGIGRRGADIKYPMPNRLRPSARAGTGPPPSPLDAAMPSDHPHPAGTRVPAGFLLAAIGPMHRMTLGFPPAEAEQMHAAPQGWPVPQGPSAVPSGKGWSWT